MPSLANNRAEILVERDVEAARLTLEIFRRLSAGDRSHATEAVDQMAARGLCSSNFRIAVSNGGSGTFWIESRQLLERASAGLSDDEKKSSAYMAIMAYNNGRK